MWANIIQKLKSIQDNLIKHEAYVEYADGISLSSVEIGGGNRSSSVQFTPTTNLNGLTRLVTDLTTILHEAQIEQEAALSVIKSEVDKCKYFSENNAAYLRHQQNSMYHTNGKYVGSVPTYSTQHSLTLTFTSFPRSSQQQWE